MADRNILEKVESASRIFAAVFIPVVLGVAGMIANQTLERSKVKDDLLKQAVDVVLLKDKMPEIRSFERRRAFRKHWLEIYNSFADIKLSSEFIAIMMEQDTPAGEKAVYHIDHLPEKMIAKTEKGSQSTKENELGHGWVAIGRLNSNRYFDADFNVPPYAVTRDGTIKRDSVINARWSVSLRTNTRNLEDREAHTGASFGLLWGGECAKVIDSLVDGRYHTWAFIEIVRCPGVAPEPALAMSGRPPVVR